MVEPTKEQIDLIRTVIEIAPQIEVNFQREDFEKWKTFVKEKSLGGIQLFADKDWGSDFIKSFGINAIPRFILIDPTGKVVDADAARPSESKLAEKLDSLLK